MTTAVNKARFGHFVFDLESGEVTNGAQATRLQPQPARVLGLLLRRAGEVVTREEIKQEIWPDTVVEFDQGLNYCIRQIRSTLDDSADVPVYVETLARRGYRFVAPVTWLGKGSAAPRRWRLAAAATAALLVGLIWVVTRSTDPDTLSASSPVPIRIAILPLRERVPGTTLTENLVTQLTNLGDEFDVLGPATTARLAGDSRPHSEIGAELGVAYVVSGGIRSVDSALFVQAVRVTDSAHVFARLVKFQYAYNDSSMRVLAGELSTKLKALSP